MDARRAKIAQRLAEKAGKKAKHGGKPDRVTPELIQDFKDRIPLKVTGRYNNDFEEMSSRAKISCFNLGQVELL